MEQEHLHTEMKQFVTENKCLQVAINKTKTIMVKPLKKFLQAPFQISFGFWYWERRSNLLI